MSFNRLDYDMCSYEHTLRESVGPGEYYLTTPPVACGPCHPNDPKYRIQRQGVIPTGDQHSTDVSSDLRNTIRHGSKCPSKKHLPKENKDGSMCAETTNPYFKECDMPSQEDTRITNPACNLRGTGWNRWEWLALNPQDNVLQSFTHPPIQYRIVAKDNHRACIPTPLDQNIPLPKDKGDLPCEQIYSTCAAFTHSDGSF